MNDQDKDFIASSREKAKKQWDTAIPFREFITRLEEALQKIEKQKRINEIQQEAINKWVPCSDHRDKINHTYQMQVCYVCENEKLKAEVERLTKFNNEVLANERKSFKREAILKAELEALRVPKTCESCSAEDALLRLLELNWNADEVKEAFEQLDAREAGEMG